MLLNIKFEDYFQSNLTHSSQLIFYHWSIAIFLYLLQGKIDVDGEVHIKQPQQENRDLAVAAPVRYYFGSCRFSNILDSFWKLIHYFAQKVQIYFKL